MPVEIEKLERFYQGIRGCCREGEYNLFLHKHLGDVFYMVAMQGMFETEYKKRLHYIVRPAHEFLMGMFGVENYSICETGKIERDIMTAEYKYMYSDPNKSHQFDMVCKDIFPSIPQLGEPFVADAEMCGFYQWDHYWSKIWAYNVGLDPDTVYFPLPGGMVDMGEKSREKLSKEVTSEFNQIVLLAPESATAAELPTAVWDALAERIHAKGYKIIVNSKKYKIKHGVSAFDLKLTLQDVVALGQRCAYVFSMRTGLCDVLVGIGERLYAIYPAMLRREYGSLVRVFEKPTGVNEILLYRWSVNSMEWEGEELSSILREWMDEQHKHQRMGKQNTRASGSWGADVHALTDRAHIYPDNNIENLLSCEKGCI